MAIQTPPPPGGATASFGPSIDPGPAAPLTATARSLDLHEGIDTPPLADPRETSCKRWPEHFALLNETTGELRPGRCRATNLCRYCQRLYVVETVEMLTLDAMEYAPTLWAVLTAREHLTRAECRRHLDMLLRSARKRWPAVQWFVQVEFQRRGALHLNLLVKGVPVEDELALGALLAARWCARVDARPVGQWVGVVEDARGVVSYLSKMLAHGLKAEQAPPIGWRGHRTSQTRGYLVRPAAVMREEARRSLRLKRALWRGVSLEVATHELEHPDTFKLARVPGRPLGVDLERELRDAARAPFLRHRVVDAGTGLPDSGPNATMAPGGVVRPGGCPPADQGRELEP